MFGGGAEDGSGIIRLIRLAGNHPDKWVPKSLVRTLIEQGVTEVTSEHFRRLFYMLLRDIHEQHRPGFGAMMDLTFCPGGDWGYFGRLIEAGDMLTFLACEFKGGNEAPS